MNRRNSIATLIGHSKARSNKSTGSSSISLSPYQGPWTFSEAAHLLRRTCFGPDKAMINLSVSVGLQGSITTLFADQPLPDPPVYIEFENDPLVPLGETWIDSLETPNIDSLNFRRKTSLGTWHFDLMHKSGMSIREKMVLFWHNHFVVFKPNTGRRMYKYMNLLRVNALGNFRTLVEGITIDPAMLVYLNGTANSRFGPNENYARELLELFTIGKGPAAGPGDYTNYTEDDIASIARALTGWRHYTPDVIDDIHDPSRSQYVESRHDTGDKQLSHRFDNIVITNEEENEYKRVIDIILTKDEVARYISRKLIRWFVHSDINSEVEANIVEPMAQIIIQNNYEIKEAVKTLISSEFFFDESIRGCMITNPIEHFFRIINTFGLAMPDDLITKHQIYRHFQVNLEENQMGLFRAPSVAGWPFLYQAPQYDKLWINAVSLPKRQTAVNKFVNGYNRNGFRLEIDELAFAETLNNPYDINELINEIASIIFSSPLTQAQIDALKNIIIPGLPDFEWATEYSDFIGGNESLEESIKSKLKLLIRTMMNMPEFYLH